MKRVTAILITIAVLCVVPAWAQTTVEEIVAWVNNDIILKSEYDRALKELRDGLAQEGGLTGARLEQEYEARAKDVLRDLIDQNLLMQVARDQGLSADIEIIKTMERLRQENKFESLDALNEWLDTWSITIADERIHGTTHEIPRERFERDERPKMIPVDQRPPSRECRTVRRRVGFDGYVEVDTNRYPVSYEWCRAEVEVQLTETDVRIVHEDESVVYERHTGRHRVIGWNGEARSVERPAKRTGAPSAPPQHDPSWLVTIGSVDSRPLDAYAAIVEEVIR